MISSVNDSSIPKICVSCASKSCLSGVQRKIVICERGASYFRDGDQMHRLDQPMPLRTLAQNLKHETHKFLQLIVNEACVINPAVSTKSVDLNDPASRIVAATVLINDFIDMIAGVNDFTPPDGAFASRQSAQIHQMMVKSIAAQSMIKNARRCPNLKFKLEILETGLSIVTGSRAIENVISILIDNCYKYSVDGTEVLISCARDDDGLGSISILNVCDALVDRQRVFEKGYQADPSNDGFGYGLHWASMMIAYMNEQLKTEIKIDLISLTDAEGKATCRVSIKGLPCG